MRDLFHAFFITKKKTPMKSHTCLSEQKLISLRKLPVEHIFYISKIILSIIYSIKLVNIRFVSFFSFFKFF